MKIEMGESLFYSWLRHVKECQLVQMNWKPSSSWQLQNEEKLKQFMETTGGYFQSQYGYAIYKKNSFSQLLMQAEIDVLGISISDDVMEIYAIDVAFHENGLNYGDRQETATRVIKKIMRTALCAIGYFGIAKGELIFASPKMHEPIARELERCILDVNNYFSQNGYGFMARVIANDDFNNRILKPILMASESVADTSELFMRSYQLIKMFEKKQYVARQSVSAVENDVSPDVIGELKVGRIAQTRLRETLRNSAIDDGEMTLLQTKDYSKKKFGINFPLLVQVGGVYDHVRYYTKPLTIKGIQYRLCSQWLEKHKPRLLAWLSSH